MSRIMVAEMFVWSHYPALRVGRLYAGKPDITRHPNTETHLVDGPDAAGTLCGLPRTRFPYEFADGTSLGKKGSLCPGCQGVGDAAGSDR